MDCKITSINRLRHPTRSAMTLVEVLVSVGLGSVLLAALAMFMMFNARSFAAMANYSDLEYASRNALDQITTAVRQTQGLTEFTTNRITLTDTNGQPLYFEYNPGQQTLVMTRNGNMMPLLNHCTALKFDVRQRNPLTNSWDQFMPLSTNLSVCKVVQIGWTCSRQLFGSSLFNTEVMQTTRIVIRHNQNYEKYAN